MEFTQYVRKPFAVQAIEITEDNIEDLAKLIGTLQTKQDGTVFVQVDRRLVPNVFRVYPGFWLTKMESNVRCYPRQIFERLFVQSSPLIDEWVEFMQAGAVIEPVYGNGTSLPDDGNG